MFDSKILKFETIPNVCSLRPKKVNFSLQQTFIKAYHITIYN